MAWADIRRQDIPKMNPNDDQVYWRISASLGLGGLSFTMRFGNSAIFTAMNIDTDDAKILP